MSTFHWQVIALIIFYIFVCLSFGYSFSLLPSLATIKSDVRATKDNVVKISDVMLKVQVGVNDNKSGLNDLRDNFIQLQNNMNANIGKIQTDMQLIKELNVKIKLLDEFKLDLKAMSNNVLDIKTNVKALSDNFVKIDFKAMSDNILEVSNKVDANAKLFAGFDNSINQKFEAKGNIITNNPEVALSALSILSTICLALIISNRKWQKKYMDTQSELLSKTLSNQFYLSKMAMELGEDKFKEVIQEKDEFKEKKLNGNKV